MTEYRNKKEKMVNDSRYGEIFQEAQGKMRMTGIKENMPGYMLMIYAYCAMKILGYENDHDLFEFVGIITVVPSINPVIKDIHPTEQWMKECLRAIGIQDDPIDFLKKII